jgi:hypothetical protein
MPHILYVILQVVWFAHLVSYLTEPRRGVKQKFKVVEVRHRVEDNQERGPESCRRPFSKMMVGTIKLGPLIVTEEDYRKVNFSSCISLPHFFFYQEMIIPINLIIYLFNIKLVLKNTTE